MAHISLKSPRKQGLVGNIHSYSLSTLDVRYIRVLQRAQLRLVTDQSLYCILNQHLLGETT